MSATTTAAALGATQPPPGAVTGGWGSNIFAQDTAAIEKAQAEAAAAKKPFLDKMQADVAKDQAQYDKAAADYKPIEKTPPPQVPENDPLKAFGSAAGIFAVLASALTHTPAVNAMNGLASAINATKANDWKAYEEGYKQWKENTDTAIRLHEVQASDMKNALEAMQSHLATGVALANAAAASANDVVAAKLLNEHRYEEYADLAIKRQEAGARMAESSIRVQEWNARKQEEMPLLIASQNLTKAMQSGDQSQIAQATAAMARVKDPAAYIGQANEQQARALAADPSSYKDGKLTDEAFQKMMLVDPRLAMDVRKSGLEKAYAPATYRLPDGSNVTAIVSQDGTAREVGTNRVVNLTGAVKAGPETAQEKDVRDIKADIAKQHPEYTPGQLDAAANQIIAVSKKVAGTSMTAWVAQHLGEYEKTFTAQNGRPPSPDELGYQASVLQGKQALNANQFNTLEDRAQQFKLALDQVQKIRNLLPKAFAIATRLGVPMEKAEAIGNMLGTDSSTDRADFQAALDFLRVNAPLLLKQANPTSRAIGSDQDMVNKIIRGEGWGDSRLNVESAMANLDSIFQQDLSIMENQARRSGRSLDLPGLDAPSTAAPPAGGNAPWETDPVAR